MGASRLRNSHDVAFVVVTVPVASGLVICGAVAAAVIVAVYTTAVPRGAV
jgi:hypothetical protein